MFEKSKFDINDLLERHHNNCFSLKEELSKTTVILHWKFYYSQRELKFKIVFRKTLWIQVICGDFSDIYWYDSWRTLSITCQHTDCPTYKFLETRQFYMIYPEIDNYNVKKTLIVGTWTNYEQNKYVIYGIISSDLVHCNNQSLWHDSIYLAVIKFCRHTYA